MTATEIRCGVNYDAFIKWLEENHPEFCLKIKDIDIDIEGTWEQQEVFEIYFDRYKDELDQKIC